MFSSQEEDKLVHKSSNSAQPKKQTRFRVNNLVPGTDKTHREVIILCIKEFIMKYQVFVCAFDLSN